MRLLSTKTYELHEFFDSQVPSYAILSHRWGEAELSYQQYRVCAQDYRKKGKAAGPGHRKIIKACDFARSRKAKWIWIDTCCIDKKSSQEVSAYCLLGIFSINMPLLYGEREKAFTRLQREIMNSTLDESLLAWRTEGASDLVPSPAFDSLTSNKQHLALLATGQSAFKQCQNVSRHRVGIAGAPRFLLAGAGLIQFRPDERSMIYQIEKKTYAIVLGCTYRTSSAPSEKWERDACCLVVTAVAYGHLRRVHLAGSIQDNPSAFTKITPTNTMRLYLHSVERDAEQC